MIKNGNSTSNKKLNCRNVKSFLRKLQNQLARLVKWRGHMMQKVGNCSMNVLGSNEKSKTHLEKVTPICELIYRKHQDVARR